jgi:hypothetical protein
VKELALLMAVAPRGFNYVKSWFATARFEDYNANQLPGLPHDPALITGGHDAGKVHLNAGKPSVELFQQLMITELMIVARNAPVTLFACDETTSQQPVKPTSSFQDYIVNVNAAITPAMRTPESEVHSYCRYSQGDVLSDVNQPLAYWKAQCEQYPQIGAVALKIFSAAGSAVFPEQNWSVAGILTKDRRSRLAPENLNEILGLFWNRTPNYGVCGVKVDE